MRAPGFSGSPVLRFLVLGSRFCRNPRALPSVLSRRANLVERPQLMSTLTIATDHDLLCTRCDTRNTGDALFCVNCGAAIQTLVSADAPLQPIERPTRCANCGNANPARAAYCVTCGASLAGGSREGDAVGRGADGAAQFGRTLDRDDRPGAWRRGARQHRPEFCGRLRSALRRIWRCAEISASLRIAVSPPGAREDGRS